MPSPSRLKGPVFLVNSHKIVVTLPRQVELSVGQKGRAYQIRAGDVVAGLTERMGRPEPRGQSLLSGGIW